MARLNIKIKKNYRPTDIGATRYDSATNGCVNLVLHRVKTLEFLAFFCGKCEFMCNFHIFGIRLKFGWEFVNLKDLLRTIFESRCFFGYFFRPNPYWCTDLLLLDNI